MKGIIFSFIFLSIIAFLAIKDFSEKYNKKIEEDKKAEFEKTYILKEEAIFVKNVGKSRDYVVSTDDGFIKLKEYKLGERCHNSTESKIVIRFDKDKYNINQDIYVRDCINFLHVLRYD